MCNLLIALAGLLPVETVRADLITTQVAVTRAAQNDRAVILSLAKRPDIASQLQALGVEPRAAEQRIAAMTDGEAHMLASNLDSLPAGGQMYGGGGGGSGASAGVVILVLAFVAFLIWWLFGGNSEKTPAS
jgi:hypothetical protein